MDDVYLRKSMVNSGVGLLAIAVSSSTSLIPDGSLAFLVSETAITVSALALMLSLAWLSYGGLREQEDVPRPAAVAADAWRSLRA